MARGKYAHIINSLPKFPGSDLSYQEKVNAVKKAMIEEDPTGNRRASVLAERYSEVRMEKEAHDELLKEVELRMVAYGELMTEAYENEGVTSLGLESGDTIRVQYEPHAVCEDREATRLWAIKNGYERDLQLPWQTLNKITKDALLEGDNEPDGVIAYSRPKIVRTKG
ncbi:MAG: hypothetical protein ACHQX3_00720 [Nitrospirales bacterium]